MNKLTFLQMSIPVAVPVALALFKHFLPRLPRPWLPILAPLLGAVVEILDSGQFGSGTALAAALGSAGVGLRELVDQLRKALCEDGACERRPPPSAPAALLIVCLAPLLAAGCKSPDATAYKAMAGIEAAADHAMQGWADYVLWKRAASDSDPDLPDQERRVQSAYASFRLAMSAAYNGRTAYLQNRQAGLPAWEAALQAAQSAAADLTRLVESLLESGRAPAAAERSLSTR